MRKLAMTLFALVLVASMAGVSFAAAPGITPSAPSHPVVPVRPAPNPQDVLWDQPLSTVNQNSYVDQLFSDFAAYSSYLADDFENAATWSIDKIFVPGGGWNGFTTLMNATSLTWQIYADNGGVPAGNPEAGGAYWTLSLAPTDAQVTITNGSYGYPSDTLLTLGTAISLPAGHWWLVFYPTMPFSGGGQYGRQPSDTLNLGMGQFINPQGGFGYGTAWQSWAIIGATNQDIAFRLEGTIPPIGVPAHLNKTKINWAPAARPGYYKVVFSARIWDNLSQPAVGTTVYGTWTYPDNSTHDKTYVTDAAGRAKFPIKETMTGTYTFCVTDISGNGYMYDPGANTAPDCLSATVTAP